MKKNYFYTLLLVVATVFAVWSCHSDKINSVLDEPNGGEGVLQMSYEIQTVQFTKTTPTDGSKLSDLEIVSGMPKFDKNKVNLTVYEDGTSDWVIRAVKIDSMGYKLNDKTAPYLSSKAALTRIGRDGIAHFFDKNNKELHNYQMAKPDFSTVIKALKNDTSVATLTASANSILGGKVQVNVAQFIEDAKRSGSIVEDLGNGVLRIKNTSIDWNQGVSLQDNQRRTVQLVDTTNRVLLGSTLYDAQNKQLSQIVFRYVLSANGTPQLDISHQEMPGLQASPSRPTKIITDSYYSNMSIRIN